MNLNRARTGDRRRVAGGFRGDSPAGDSRPEGVLSKGERVAGGEVGRVDTDQRGQRRPTHTCKLGNARSRASPQTYGVRHWGGGGRALGVTARGQVGLGRLVPVVTPRMHVIPVLFISLAGPGTRPALR